MEDKIHLLILSQASFPDAIVPQATDRFIREITNKIYKNTGIDEATGWSQIRPREIRLWDFTIPEKALDEVLTDLAPYINGKIAKVSKILNTPVIGLAIQKATGIKPVDIEPYKEKTKNIKTKYPVYLAIIGMVEDAHNEQGLEMI